MFKLSGRSISNRRGIKDPLIEISNLAITITPIDFGHGPFSGLRTPQEQAELHMEGRSKADGYVIKSFHQSGNALDFYAYINHKASWLPEHLAMVATAHLQAASHLGYKIEWGGLWSPKPDSIYGWDMAHIQLKEV